jgi:DNA-binding GntR family transcriptional regulator
VQRFGVETERHVQRVAEVVADDALARELGCRPGRRWLRISSLRMIPGDATKTPILAIRRQYLFSSNEMAEVSLSIHPADRYGYTTRLMRKDSERE